jgi:hypothetical protein
MLGARLVRRGCASIIIPSAASISKRRRQSRISAGLSGLNCESELAFLALLGKLLSAFFGVDENGVRVT